jgi:hypothetical protein
MDSAEFRGILQNPSTGQDPLKEWRSKTMEAILGGLLVVVLFVGPLAARLVFDRRLERANAIAADLRAAVRRRLGGESMVSVEVRAAGVRTPGRVVLSAPSAYLGLIEKVWPAVARRVPTGYELVVPARSAAPGTRTAASADSRELPRAA